jgi:phage gp46-like protein
MTDVRIVNVVTLQPLVTMDILLKPMGTLDETQELATSLLIALGTDRLAEPDDDLPDLLGPDGVVDRRGWWGDLDAELLHNGWPIGSRLWELMRAKITPIEARIGSTLGRAEMYTREALQPFIDQAVCTAVDVYAERTDQETIQVSFTMYRGPLPAIALQFQNLWDEIRTIAWEDPYITQEYS